MPFEKTPKMLEIEQRFGKDLEGILREKYVDKHMSSEKVAKRIGVVSYSSVRRWLYDCGIKVRSAAQTRLPPKFAKPSKKQLQQLYVTEKLSAGGIAQKFGINRTTVYRLLQENKIPARAQKDSRFAKGTRPSKEALEELYVIKRMSMLDIARKLEISYNATNRAIHSYGISARNKFTARLEHIRPSDMQLKQWYAIERRSGDDIARKLGIGATTVRVWLRNAGISVRNKSSSRLPAGVVKPPRAQLEHMYLAQMMSTTAIAKEVDVGASTVGLWLHEYGIPRRDISKAKLPPGFVKPSKEQLKQWYTIERMSTVDIAKKLRVCDTTAWNWLREHNIPLRNPNNCNKDAVKELLKTYVGEKKYAS